MFLKAVFLLPSALVKKMLLGVLRTSNLQFQNKVWCINQSCENQIAKISCGPSKNCFLCFLSLFKRMFLRVLRISELQAENKLCYINQRWDIQIAMGGCGPSKDCILLLSALFKKNAFDVLRTSNLPNNKVCCINQKWESSKSFDSYSRACSARRIYHWCSDICKYHTFRLIFSILI